MRLAFDEKIDHLASAFDTRISSVQATMATVQGDMVSLADRVTTLEHNYHSIITPTGHNTLSRDTVTVASQQQNLSVVSTFCKEMKLRESKKCNVIISGLQLDPHLPDLDLAIKIFDELDVHERPSLVKRIGKSNFGKPPLLLVSLPTETARNNITRNAKRLRHSTDDFIRQNVFVNPDRTRLEIDELKQRRSRRTTANVLASSSAQPSVISLRDAEPAALISSFTQPVGLSLRDTHGNSKND
jgi:hypothetical protein